MVRTLFAPKKLSFPSTMPFCTVQSSFSGVMARPPEWVNGLYWNRYDREANGVVTACTVSYSRKVANFPPRKVVPFGPTFGA